jgi:hypothetical protein
MPTRIAASPSYAANFPDCNASAANSKTARPNQVHEINEPSFIGVFSDSPSFPCRHSGTARSAGPGIHIPVVRAKHFRASSATARVMDSSSRRSRTSAGMTVRNHTQPLSSRMASCQIISMPASLSLRQGMTAKFSPP